MTPKQIERIQNKIKKIKRALAADKKHWGGYYHDGQGLRYLPPQFYLEINDYSGAMRYFNWFNKNFEEDSGYPIFLFEWTITLFKKKKVKEAEKKALETFCSNTYLIDVFLGKDMLEFNKNESSNWEYSSLIEHLIYSKDQEELSDFYIWLENFTTSQTFYDFANKFIEIEKAINDEPMGKKRSQLFDEKLKLLESIK
ncbi:hypothetical protein KO493_01860 [Tamlana agarivorans]|uniref:Uncharacterized protein n=1 Tax=Pseudotamlana agarivorans TaxID=481183 RepID=A0ACC5U534_9FLAO|nr:hypothetical protein [Tamlana agarivorans]MBU2949436.1 hypothetical protein [Tamlana agarivorans]